MIFRKTCVELNDVEQDILNNAYEILWVVGESFCTNEETINISNEFAEVLEKLNNLMEKYIKNE